MAIRSNYLVMHTAIIKPSDLDDFSKINGQILKIEDEKVLANSLYRILSLLSVSFIDLGIIIEK